jgi:starch synthase (maltosyl-transferring)
MITLNAKKRVVIENVCPETDQGEFAVRRVQGETVAVSADIFADGFEQISALLVFHPPQTSKNQTVLMKQLVNDRWQAEFPVNELGPYTFTIQAWVDHFKTWQTELKRKMAAVKEIKGELLAGAVFIEQAAKRADENDARTLWTWTRLLQNAKDWRMSAALALSQELSLMMAKYPDKIHVTNYERELKVFVDRPQANFSTWYQIFPRSCGTFTDLEKRLPEIARMGFDILYLPPIHPIGQRNRRGNNYLC